jgi:drug/metabolite transporter (DMT)-like permease
VTSRANLVRAVLWMIGTLLSFSAMALSVRGLAGVFSIAEILTIRSSVGLTILTAIALVTPSLWQDISLRRIGMHVARNSIHLGAQYLWALGLTLLPLATVFALEFTMPAWTVPLAFLLLGEKPTPPRIGSVVCGFIGVLIILRPGISDFNPAALLVLVAAFGYATINVLTKKLTSTESPFAILVWMSLIQLVLGYAFSDPLFFQKITAHSLIPMAGIGIAGLSAHFCLTHALKVADATVVIPLDFMRIPLIAIVGWAFYGEALDVFVFAGALVIVLGVLWALNAEARKRPA